LKTNSWDKGDNLTNKIEESTMSEAAEDQAKANGKWRLIVLLLAVVAALVLAKVFGLGERIGELRGWIESLGPWGPVVFVLLYIVAVVAMLPGSALTLAAGALFGSVVGVVVVSVGATLGAGAAFLVSRYFARDAAANWLGKNEKFRQLDQLTEKHGAIIVALTRLVPIFPFNLLNYGFGLTRVPFRTYLFWSWLCMLPGTLLYVVGADAVTKGVTQGKVPWPLVGGAAVAAAVLTMLVRFARRKLDDGAARKEAGNA
jgi:uncharacterized membrane protein YdjX (TVP38/TMEM64 family)